MSSLDDVLREKTHKGAGVETGKRIYYTLHADAGLGAPTRLEVHRTTKLLGMLVAKLQGQGVLTEGDIDEMLLGVLA